MYALCWLWGRLLALRSVWRSSTRVWRMVELEVFPAGPTPSNQTRHLQYVPERIIREKGEGRGGKANKLTDGWRC